MNEYGLKINATANANSVNFLDITRDLRESTNRPYMKPNDELLYVHRQSNHPASVLESIPLSVNKRLSSISASEDILKQASPLTNKHSKIVDIISSSNFSHLFKTRVKKWPFQKHNMV